MLEYFNNHYEQNYIPSWMNCLDKGMRLWLISTVQVSCLSQRIHIQLETSTNQLLTGINGCMLGSKLNSGGQQLTKESKQQSNNY